MTLMHTNFIQIAAVVVKLLIILPSATSHKPTQKMPFKKIDLSGSGDVKEACNKLTSGKTEILALGRLLSTFILLTTDLMLFELPLEMASPFLNRPYHINVDQTPTHFQNRNPVSYQAVKAIADRITTAFTMAVKDLSPASINHEYLAFAYEDRGDNGGNEKAKVTTAGCLLIIDLRIDKVASSGLCNNKLAAITGISFSVADKVTANYVTATEISYTNKFAFFVNELQENKPTPELCSSLEQDHCKALYLEDQGEFESILPHWRSNLSRAISSAGYWDNKQQAVLVVDSSGKVTRMKQQEGSIDLLVETWSLDNFIACNYRSQIKFQLTQTKAIVVIVVAIVLQLLICLGLYCTCKSTQSDTGDVRGFEKKRRKKSKSLSSKKSKSSLKSGSSVSSAGKSKKRKSISSRASVSLGGSPSTSRKSRQSISRKSGRRSGFSNISSSAQSPKSQMSSFSRKSSGVGERSSKQMSE